jgi:hypothetical protein
MATVKNKTGDVLALFRSDAPPVDPGGEVTLRDELFAGRAWPTSTWELVTAPGDGYTDASDEDAHLFLPESEPEPEPAPEDDDTEEDDD